MLDKRNLLVIGAVLAGLAVVGFFVGQEYFFPETGTTVDETAPPAETSEVLRSGTFSGKAGHSVSGMVKLIKVGDRYYLRFENYRQTQGPDVFLYLTPSDDPDTRDEVYAGVKILVDGGADGGEITKEGNFNQRLPAGIDIAKYGGVAIWCDRFSVPFGSAPLKAT